MARRVDQRLIIRPDCGGLESAGAFYFGNATGCTRACSLRIQATRSIPNSYCNSKLLLPLMPGRWPEEALRVRSARAPAVHPASCPVIPAAAMARRARASAAVPPDADCPADLRAAARLVFPASPAGFRAVQSAFTITERIPRSSNRNLVIPACGRPLQCCGRRDRARMRRNNWGDNAREFRARRCRARPLR